MTAQVFQNMLGDFMSNQMTDFLKRLSEKHSLDFEELANEWSAQSKTKSSKKPSENTIDSLKALLKEKGLPVSGNKTVLKQRLEDFEKGPQKKEPTVKELKALLKEKGLPISGNKTVLKQRLAKSEEVITQKDYNELYDKCLNDNEFYKKYKDMMDEVDINGDYEGFQEISTDWITEEIAEKFGDDTDTLELLSTEISNELYDKYIQEYEES
jgi:translation initiation factor 2 beta subunit (eIF-2beta)/eIF-5